MNLNNHAMKLFLPSINSKLYIENFARFCCFILCLLLFTTVIQAQEYQLLGDPINGPSNGANSGLAISMSSDGQHIAIGSSYTGNPGISPGLVRVNEFSNGNWVQIGSDILGVDMDDEFGISVSLNADGTIVAIGSVEHEVDGERRGHVRIFEYDGNNWIQIGDDIDGRDLNETFGHSIALSGDGLRLIVGAPFGRTNGLFTGDARIFSFSGGAWNQLGDDLGASQNSSYGRAVSISADGTKVAVGGPLNDDNGFNTGIVEIFEFSNSSWSQIGQTIFGTEESAAAGWSLKLNSDGSRVIVGAPKNTGFPEDLGSARVYELDANTWNLLGDVITSANPSSFFATSVSINGLGDRVVVGSPLQVINGGTTGCMKVFQLNANLWEQVGDDIEADGFLELLGQSVDISDNGSRVAGGANGNGVNGFASGHTKILQDESLSTSQFDLEDASISLWPNPASSNFKVLNTNELGLDSVFIYDIQGKLLLEVPLSEYSEITDIQLPQISAGVYTVVLQGNERSIVKKLIIE